MEKTIKFRDLHWRDIPSFCRILMNIWTLGRRPQMSLLGKAVAGLLYVLCILEESEKVIVAVNNEAVGFCGYGLGQNKKIYRQLRKAILAILPNKDQKLYQRYYNTSCYGELHASKQNAEITILIITPQYYGKGLGKQLIEEVQKKVYSNGCQSIFALSDSGCHWHFYEKQGYKKVFEQEELSTNPLGERDQQYIFQKNL